MNILVTGGNGFIGSHVVDKLVEAGHRIRVLDIKKPCHRGDVEFYEGDITSREDIKKSLLDVDMVYHIAAFSDINLVKANPLLTIKYNIMGTAHLLEESRKQGVNRFIFASSIYVPSKRGHLYTTAKLASERLCKDYYTLYSLPYTILRYGTAYGPRSRKDDVISTFIARALRGENLLIYGSGEQKRNFIYVEDLALGNVAALKLTAENQTYTLAGERAISIRELAEMVRSTFEETMDIEYHPAREADYQGRNISSARTKRELGWEPKVDLEKGIKRYIAWYQTEINMSEKRMNNKRYLRSFSSKIRGGTKILLFELARHSNKILRTIPVAPQSASINITDNCNSMCITCNMWRNKSTNELTTAELEDVLTQLKDIGIVSVGFEGGEPLLRNDLPQVVEKAHQLDFQSIGMMTNGLLLTRKKAENLIQCGLSSIGVSIDGIGETHDLVRGIKGAYEKSMRALEELVKLRDSKYPELKVGMGTILMQPTIEEIIPLANIAHRLEFLSVFSLLDDSPFCFEGIDRASLWIEEQNKLDRLINELYSLKKVNSALKSYSHARLEYTRRYFKDPKRADIPCILGYLVIYIGAHGEVYPGCLSLGSVGNLREKSLKEIVESQEYKRRVQAMFRKECRGAPVAIRPT